MEHKTPLLKLQDGDILNFSEDHWARGGCDTCDYGSSYSQTFTVETTKGTRTFDFEAMYDYKISHDALLKLILPNVAHIQTLTIEEFYEWLQNGLNKHGSHY